MSTYNHTPIPYPPKQAGDASTFNGPFGQLDAAIGSRSGLTTTAKSTVVAAINELDADVGVLASLGTTAKTNLVAAINEVHTLAHGSSPVSGISGEVWTINDDMTNANVDLVFGRTTGGNATVRWNGSALATDKVISHVLSTAYTNQKNIILSLSALTSGVATAGFGGEIDLYAENAAGNEFLVGNLEWGWGTATGGAEQGRCSLSAYGGSGGGTVIAWGANASGDPMIGFLGAAVQAQASHIADLAEGYSAGDLDTEAEVISAINATNAAINDLLAALETYGLLKTS